MLHELEQRIAALETVLNQCFRVGDVTSINPGAATARVKLPDSGGVVSYNLPILFQKAHLDKFYTMPDVGEQVLCVFLPNGLEQGFILGSIYSQIVSTPVNDPDKTHFKFKDGTTVEYDRKTHKLTVDIKGDIDVKATGNISINGARIDLN